jgi:hypothetical protein
MPGTGRVRVPVIDNHPTTNPLEIVERQPDAVAVEFGVVEECELQSTIYKGPL